MLLEVPLVDDPVEAPVEAPVEPRWRRLSSSVIALLGALPGPGVGCTPGLPPGQVPLIPAVPPPAAVPGPLLAPEVSELPLAPELLVPAAPLLPTALPGPDMLLPGATPLVPDVTPLVLDVAPPLPDDIPAVPVVVPVAGEEPTAAGLSVLIEPVVPRSDVVDIEGLPCANTAELTLSKETKTAKGSLFMLTPQILKKPLSKIIRPCDASRFDF